MRSRTCPRLRPPLDRSSQLSAGTPFAYRASGSFTKPIRALHACGSPPRCHGGVRAKYAMQAQVGVDKDAGKGGSRASLVA